MDDAAGVRILQLPPIEKAISRNSFEIFIIISNKSYISQLNGMIVLLFSARKYREIHLCHSSYAEVSSREGVHAGVGSLTRNRHICNSKITGRPISWAEWAESSE